MNLMNISPSTDEQRISKEVEGVANSDLFDDRYYRLQTKVQGGRGDLVRHYLEHGEPALVAPSREFDPAFYYAIYPEVAAEGRSALLHYLDHGRAQWRYTSREQLRLDAGKIDQAGLIDAAEARATPDVPLAPPLSAPELYLIARGGAPLSSGRFDEAFYLDAYPDARAYPRRPMRHYADVGGKQRRVRTAGELDYRRSMIAEGFDPSFYRGQFQGADVPDDALTHYVLHGARLGHDPSRDFSSDYYLRTHLDVFATGLDPFQHYLQYGQEQGRSGRPASAWPSPSETLANSDLFDDRYYRLQTKVQGGRGDLVRHYLEHGEPALVAPSREFDPAFYYAIYPEVAAEGRSALLHYLDHGRAQWRYTSREQLRLDAGKIDQAGLIDAAEARATPDVPLAPPLSAPELYLIARGGAPLSSGRFDEAFYLDAYPDARAYPRRPMRHYADVGGKQRRVRTAGELDYRRSMIAEGFDPSFYRGQFQGADVPDDALTHYVLHGARLGHDPSRDFSSDYYLRTHLDVFATGLDPFQHYLQYGQEQGRSGRPASAWPSPSETLANSDLFDDRYYRLQTKVQGGRGDLVRHYLEHGEPALVAPSREFDPAFYYAIYPEVAAEGRSALLHYLDHGRAQWRYTSREQLRLDAGKIDQAGLIDAAEARATPDVPLAPPLSAPELYLIARGGAPLSSGRFDEAFYLDAYPDARAYPRRPMRHYADVGGKQRRVRTAGELDYRRSMIAEGFDPSFYRGQFQGADVPDDALTHYVLHGARLGHDPSRDFSSDYYLRRYTDLTNIKMDAFQHFVQFGKEEGRIGFPDVTSSLQDGNKQFDEKKETLLLGIHEGSRTGAPLLGLSIAAKLSSDYNIIIYLGRSGDLLDDLKSICFLIIVDGHSGLDLEYLLKDLMQKYALSVAIYNSIEIGSLAEPALWAGLPTVGLIHEFSEYTRPASKMTRIAELTDRVLVPSKLIEDSLQKEVSSVRSATLNNVVVRPQGRLPFIPAFNENDDLSSDDLRSHLRANMSPSPRIVFGAGHVQIRKGVDLFVQTAAKVRSRLGDDVRFLWIGSGYDVENDPHYSIWIADMVQRLDLQDIVCFLPAQSSLDVAFSLADIFYLPSRLDPLPNVAIDALASGKPIVCFKNATGIAEYLADDRAEGVAVDFCDVDQATNAIIDILSKPISGSNVAIAEQYFDFDAYISCLVLEMEAAKLRKQLALNLSQQIGAANDFDCHFYEGKFLVPEAKQRRRAILEYVTRGLNGISAFNSRIGLNEGAYRRNHPFVSSDCSMEKSQTTQVEKAAGDTHRCFVLDEMKQQKSSGEEIVLHLHLHYSDLASEFHRLLSLADYIGDIIITTTSEKKKAEIELAFKRFKGGDVRVIECVNRGRDIGPFITTIGPLLHDSKYNIVGHLHGKRSLVVGHDFGNKWRNFMVDTLVGDSMNLRKILAILGGENDIGLLFPEDRNCVGWTKNLEVAKDIAARVNGALPLPEFPIFPIGTMFWARVDALSVLWKLDLTLEDFPPEPLPYDGTVLHALERMLPSLCEAAGFEWCTVSKQDAAR